MPRGRGKGGKNRKKGKNLQLAEKREIDFKTEGQEYAKVLKMLGNGRLEAICQDGVKRQCTIRGKLKNRVWINSGDIILVGLREFENHKADVLSKFYEEEVRELMELGELPYDMKDDETDSDEDIRFEECKEEEVDFDQI